MNTAAIYGSPRKDGNSDLLLRSFLRGVRQQGGDVHEIFLRDLAFSPCINCGACNKTGICALRDDMDKVYPYLQQSDMVVISAPVFFYAMNALAKAMVDRSQALWSKKYLLKEHLSEKRRANARGILLSVGGSKGKKNFEGIILTARYFFDALDMDFSHHLVYGGIDSKGAILEHTTACDEAYNLGISVATDN